MDTIDRIRRFNRFYTHRIGVLREGLHDSPFSLAEARVLYEIATAAEPLTATALARDLGLDPGYLSRILGRFEQRGLLARSPSPDDRRQGLLSLTPPGREAFLTLERAARDALAASIASLAEPEREALVASMETVSQLLGDTPAGPVTLRDPLPGDLGWVVEAHGVRYALEYGWDQRFEGLVAEIVGSFARAHDPRRERCWIAVRDGRRVGSVFVVRHPEEPDTAKLRLLLVEPAARGAGLGRRLVAECTRFAREAGYRQIVLWTNDVLHAARRIYQEEGYVLLEESPHRSFGHELVSQTWSLRLDGA